MLRPNGKNAVSVTLTQLMHEWAHALEAQGWVIADGGRGKPSFPADKDGFLGLRQAIDTMQGAIPYGTDATGEAHYRQIAAISLTHEYKCEFKPEQIVFTPGGQFGLSAAFYLAESLHPGGKIITARPWYLNHAELASMFSGASILAETKAKNKIEAMEDYTSQALEAALQCASNPAAFLFCNPANPSGRVLRKKDWLNLLPLLKQYPKTPIILDEAFAEVVFDLEKHYSLDARFEISLLHAAPELQHRTILLRSGTKGLGFSGERLAVMAVANDYIEPITSFQSRLIGNSPLTGQAGMAACLKTMTVQKKAMISDYYEANMRFLYEQFEKAKLLPANATMPEGCFYFLANFSKFLGQPIPLPALSALQKSPGSTIENDIDLAFSLLFGLGQKNNHGLALIPASGFGLDPKAGLLRVSFSPARHELERIAEFARRLAS